MNAEHEHVTVNLPPPYYTNSTADTWHPTLVPKYSGFWSSIECWIRRLIDRHFKLSVADKIVGTLPINITIKQANR